MSVAIKFKKDVYSWMESGPFTADTVKDLATEALAVGVNISEEIAGALYRLPAIQIDILYREFHKNPNLFDNAYWVLQTKDILNMKSDQLLVLSYQVGLGTDTLSEVGQSLNEILSTSPAIALKFFQLLQEADRLKKKQKQDSFADAIVGQVHSLASDSSDTAVSLRRYGDRWKIREIKPDGRFVFIPVKGGKFSYTTSLPWTIFN
jgi:hypothetical protein